jgi:hypothetical protein
MDKARYPQYWTSPGKNQKQTRCLQINLQHSKAATCNMMKMLEKEETDLIFTQEIYEYQNRPAEIGKKYRIYMAGNGKHRAAIVIPNNEVEAILISQVSTKTRYS